MADKQISELTQVGALSSDSLFVVQQSGAAYKATGAQVAGMSGGGSGDSGGTVVGDSTYYLDLTGQVEVDSLPDTLEEDDQRWTVEIDAAALVAHSGPVAIRFLDSRFPEEVMTVHATNRRLITDAEDGDLYLVIDCLHCNPGAGNAADANIKLTKSGDGYTAKFYYNAYFQKQSDFTQTDSWKPDYIDNSPVSIDADGYTVIDGERALTGADFADDDTFVLTLDGGKTLTGSFTVTDGAVTGLTLDGHTVTISGVSV